MITSLSSSSSECLYPDSARKCPTAVVLLFERRAEVYLPIDAVEKIAGSVESIISPVEHREEGVPSLDLLPGHGSQDWIFLNMVQARIPHPILQCL